jgi:hypothetical protein
MKTTKKIALATAAIVSAGAANAATTNMENPLYIPAKGEISSKTTAGIMYKKADATDAMKKKGAAGQTEFPIYRASEELGYGITDRLSAKGQFGYTYDGDIDRKGMNLGRVGLNYRVLNGESTNGWILDAYADAHLGGVSKMTGEYSLSKGFKYDNYTNGRWGYYAGLNAGKTFGKLTTSVFVEMLQTFGNANNEINVKPAKGEAEAKLTPLGGAAKIEKCIADNSGVLSDCVTSLVGELMGGGMEKGKATETAQSAIQAYGASQLPDSLSINLKGQFEFNTGVKALYELNDKWSLGGGFTFKHHQDNEVESFKTKVENPVAAEVAEGLAESLKDMNDGFYEYAVTINASRQLTDTVQATVYGEYTFDTANSQSQNGTDVKAELGLRLNARF